MRETPDEPKFDFFWHLTFHCTFHLHSLHLIYIPFSKMYGMALLCVRAWGRDPNPHAEQQLREWLALGAGCAGDGLGKGVQCFRFGCNHGVSLGCLSQEWTLCCSSWRKARVHQVRGARKTGTGWALCGDRLAVSPVTRSSPSTFTLQC